MKHYDAYIFDLYGTLVDIHTDENKISLWRQTADFYTSHGAEYEAGELKQACYGKVRAAEQEAKAAENRGKAHESCPEIDLGEVFRQLFLEKGVPADEGMVVEATDVFRRGATTHIRTYAGAHELLDALRESGSKVYLLSNAQRLFTLPELRNLGLLERFDDIFISSDYGCKKPDVRFFQELIDRHSLDASKCLMIGNDPVCDILGGRNAGMDTYYIHSALSPQPAPPLHGRGKLMATYYQMEMNLRRVKRRLLNTP